MKSRVLVELPIEGITASTEKVVSKDVYFTKEGAIESRPALLLATSNILTDSFITDSDLDGEHVIPEAFLSGDVGWSFEIGGVVSGNFGSGIGGGSGGGSGGTTPVLYPVSISTEGDIYSGTIVVSIGNYNIDLNYGQTKTVNLPAGEYHLSLVVGLGQYYDIDGVNRTYVVEGPTNIKLEVYYVYISTGVEFKAAGTAFNEGYCLMLDYNNDRVIVSFRYVDAIFNYVNFFPFANKTIYNLATIRSTVLYFAYYDNDYDTFCWFGGGRLVYLSRGSPFPSGPALQLTDGVVALFSYGNYVFSLWSNRLLIHKLDGNVWSLDSVYDFSTNFSTVRYIPYYKNNCFVVGLSTANLLEILLVDMKKKTISKIYSGNARLFYLGACNKTILFVGRFGVQYRLYYSYDDGVSWNVELVTQTGLPYNLGEIWFHQNYYSSNYPVYVLDNRCYRVEAGINGSVQLMNSILPIIRGCISKVNRQIYMLSYVAGSYYSVPYLGYTI